MGGVTGSATCTTLTYSITVNTTSVTDTSVAVEISHSDEAGNSVTDSTTVVKDVDAPLVAITSAQNILIANESTYTVGGTCSGSTENVSVSIGGIAVTAACDGTNWTTASTDVSGLDDGSVSITADLSDSNGNEAVQATASVTKDSDGPSVTNIVLDTSDGVYPSGTVQVTVTFSEDATFDTAGGTPSIALTIGSNARTMSYTSQPTATTAIFYYQLVMM